MVKSALSTRIKETYGKEYVYGKVNGTEKCLHPKGKLQKLNEGNLMKLVLALNNKENLELEKNKVAREQLLSLLSKARRFNSK